MSLTPKNWKSFQHYKDRAPAWIKLHKGLLDDFAFSRLPVASRALAPLLWLLASEYDEGQITAPLEEIAFRLHMSEQDFVAALKPLVTAGFFSDASDMLADSYQDACLEKEREEEKEKRKISRFVASATQPSENEKFEEFWKVYPRRDGPNPKKPAEQKFNSLAKTGVDADAMIAGAKQLAAEEARRGNVGTKFIPQAITWLNQQRWADHAVIAFEQPNMGTDWDAILTTYRKIGVWSQRVSSPPPGDPACTVPREKLIAHGFGEKVVVASVAFEIPKLKSMGQA